MTVPGELAEAVADVLARFAPSGTAVSGVPPLDTADHLTVQAYLEEPSAGPDAKRRIAEALWHLSQITPIPEPSFTWIEEEDWAESWKEHFRPLSVGRRLVVVPAWLANDEPERLPIVLEPGMAFGTGAHPSTRLCLEALEERVRPGDVVVDVGCGSGILGIAAARLGARRVLACDIDADAVAAARRGAELNGLTGTIEVFHGSVAEAAARLSQRKADVVLANILAPTLEALLRAGLIGLARRDGVIVLAGILSGQRDGVARAAEKAGLRLTAETAEGDWVALIFRKA